MSFSKSILGGVRLGGRFLVGACSCHGQKQAGQRTEDRKTPHGLVSSVGMSNRDATADGLDAGAKVGLPSITSAARWSVKKDWHPQAGAKPQRSLTVQAGASPSLPLTNITPRIRIATPMSDALRTRLFDAWTPCPGRPAHAHQSPARRRRRPWPTSWAITTTPSWPIRPACQRRRSKSRASTRRKRSADSSKHLGRLGQHDPEELADRDRADDFWFPGRAITPANWEKLYDVITKMRQPDWSKHAVESIRVDVVPGP